MRQMNYLTYDEYKEYSPDSTLSEPNFVLSELKARKRIDYLTANRVQGMKEIPVDVKLCMVTLINLENSIGVEKQAEKPAVSSFSTDGYQETYSSIASNATDINKTLNDSVARLLYGVRDDNGVELLYRGVTP